MPEESSRESDHILEQKDLGNGTKQITLQVDASKVQEYYTMLHDKGAEIVSQDYRLGKGSIKSRYEPYLYPDSWRWNSNHTPYTRVLHTPQDPHEKIALAMTMYRNEPMVGTVIDLMVDFSASGFINDCDDQEVKKLYDTWCKDIQFPELIESLFLEFYRSGNITIYRSPENATVKVNKKQGGKDVGSQSYQFPAGYTLLNPLHVFIEGSLLFNQEVVSLKISDELRNLITSDQSPKKLLAKIPKDIIKAVRSDKDRVILDPDLVTRITRKKQPYERYASPSVERVFEPVIYKQKLRLMDASTIEGITNQLITVTVGDKDFPATDDDLQAIATLFQTPNKAYTVFWNHTLKVTFHKPEGLETLNGDKYKHVDEEILAGLGVSRVLVDGGGSNFSTAWVSILSLIERLENAREKVRSWIEKEYLRIANENGLKTVPTARFSTMNLREDTYIRDVILAMYDRGLLDEEDVIQETGRNYQAIVDAKKRNKKNESLFFPPAQPFQGNQPGPNPGRAPGPNKNGYKNRKTSPDQSGKPPKPKTSKAAYYAIALYRNLEEEYGIELEELYSSIESEISTVMEENKEKGSKMVETMVMATLLALFQSMNKLGSDYLTKAFDYEAVHQAAAIDPATAQQKKKELIQWNESYVTKLAHDIFESVKGSMSKGSPANQAIEKAFQSHRYRVTLIAQAGIVESVRQSKIESGKALGHSLATWITHLDDATCQICRGLNGHQFPIQEVPARPHSGCRCELEFD